jgi:hypothetical protein
MNTYVVSLFIGCGEYEKSTTVIKDADDADSAMKQALLGQCHCICGLDEGAYWDNDSLYDGYGEFCYTVWDVKLVAPDHVGILKYYL